MKKAIKAIACYLVGKTTGNYTCFGGTTSGAFGTPILRLRKGYIALMDEAEEVGGIYF